MTHTNTEMLQTLEIRRNALKKQLKSFFGVVQSGGDNVNELQERYEKIHEVWQKFSEINLDMECLLQTEKAVEQIKELVTNSEIYEKMYYEHRGKAREKLLAGVKQEGPAENQIQSMKMKLPPLTIQPFSGKYEHWLSFKDSFTKAVHDQDLPNVQKFQILKGLLQGDALRVIDALEATDANYEEAWSLIQERYANTRIIINTHMKGLFEYPAISKATHSNLRTLVDSVRTHIRSLRSLEEPVDEWDTILIYLILNKLDNNTKEEWEREVSTKYEKESPKFDNLLKFLERICLMHEMVDRGKTKTDYSQTSLTMRKDKKVSLATTAIASPATTAIAPPATTAIASPATAAVATVIAPTYCSLCNEEHPIFKCDKFLKLSVDARNEKAWKLRLCLNCLKKGHIAKNCQSSSCKYCRFKHNTLLHRNTDEKSNQAYKEKTNRTEPPNQNSGLYHCIPKLTAACILCTARVYISDVDGQQHECRVLFDPGSQVNIITEELVQKLRLPFYRTKSPLSLAQQMSVESKKSVKVTIKSMISRYTTEMECLALRIITEKLPQVQLNSKRLMVPDGIQLADPDFRIPGNIDMLLGGALFWKTIIPGENIRTEKQPTFQNTEFGWIVGGEFLTRETKQGTSCNLVTTLGLKDQIEQFWKLEEVDTRREKNNANDYCEEHFKRTYTRDSEGRFQVELPQDSNVILGDSYQQAFKRLQAMERRLQRQPEVKQQYVQFLADYETTGHMSSRQETQRDNDAYYYIPHQPVIRAQSLTTKLRVVFDASSKTTVGTSLNDRLLPGPNLQNDIFNILVRFRIHEFVITADIKQMFRQIEIAEKDRKLQQILWRTDPNDTIKIFTLNTITYGTSCAPFLAMRCLRELALLEKDAFPKASEVLQEDFYMDDLLTGTSTLEGAIELQQKLTTLLKSGQFQLRKWRSNEPKVLESMEARKKTDELLILNQDESIKTLGLLWNSVEDFLQYNIQLFQREKFTKRQMLSAISKIYDPLGIIGPVIVTAKLLMQELWKLKLEWDEHIPSSLESTWKRYLESLTYLPDLRIKRNVNPQNRSNDILLHGFCDASERAYGACIYVVSKNSEGMTQSHLLCSKSKVAPLKQETLPRLELCAAVLLAQLISVVKAAIKCNVIETHLWSDSTITLSWIENPPIKRVYEMNRVTKIRAITAGCVWHHISTKENPADVVSRGTTPQKLLAQEIWWSGPSWLTLASDWPASIARVEIEDVGEQVIATVVEKRQESKLLRRFSRFLKLQRVVAYCIRFKNNLRRQSHSGPLTAEELSLAEKQIIRWVQAEAFHEDIQKLKMTNSVGSKSPLLALNPFLDSDELIRVGGRLRNAEISEDQKHPLIIPAGHFTTHIIMRDEHIRLLHCGPQQLLHSVRQKYWPVSGGREARKVTKNCIHCYKYRPKIPDCIMGDLPPTRVNIANHPFETTGIDYAGPLQIRESRRRGRIHISKGYIAVFTCFSTKAVHLELVTDLTTETFLAALRRFVSRRGPCSSIYSDNATNFVGAARELQEIYQFLNQHNDDIMTSLAVKGITWSFIPPRTPHFGGLWESAVKSVKKHLYTITKGLTYTFEEYYTLLTEIEAILNSRPLMPMSSDPNDLSVLTPAHFLIGTSLLGPGTKCFLDVPENQLSRWQHNQKLKQHFWQRWQREYLNHLQCRPKWKAGSPDVEIGTMVLLIEDNQPPLKWNLGRIVKVFPGTDKVIRSVEVKTAQGIFRRGIKRICILPINQ